MRHRPSWGYRGLVALRQVGFTSNERREQLIKQLGVANDGALAFAPTAANGEGLGGAPNGAPLVFSPLSSSGKRTKLQEAASAMRLEAVTVLQAHARGRTARLWTAWRRAQADLEYDAATYIQAILRGWRLRLMRDATQRSAARRAKFGRNAQPLQQLPEHLPHAANGEREMTCRHLQPL